MKKYLYTLLILLVVLLGAVAVKATVGSSLNGWAWSSNIGWISFSSLGTNSAVDYKVIVDDVGNMSGYAWSSNIGWISFNPADLSGCTGATSAHVSTSTGAVTGWARAIVAKGRTDGWDGCIKLSEGSSGTLFPTETGTITGTKGVAFDSVTSKFKGFAWGSDVVGWTKFDPILSGGNGDSIDVNCPDCTTGGGGGGGSLSGSCDIPGGLVYTLATSTDTTVNVTFTANPYGGTAPYTYSWNGSAYDTNSSVVIAIARGDHGPTLNIKDTNGNIISANQCSTASITINNANTGGNSGSCIVPQNTDLCGMPDVLPTSTSTRIYNSCPATSAIVSQCSYKCSTGFALRAGQCVNAIEVEI